MTTPAKAAETCPKCGQLAADDMKWQGGVPYDCGSEHFCSKSPLGIKPDKCFFAQSQTCRIAELESSLARVIAERDELKQLDDKVINALRHQFMNCNSALDEAVGLLRDTAHSQYCQFEQGGACDCYCKDIDAFLARLSADAAKEQP